MFNRHKIVFLLLSILIFYSSIIFSKSFTLTLDEKIKTLSSFYNLKIYTQTFTPSDYSKKWAKFEYLTDKDKEILGRYLNIFFDEWTKYPKEWISKTKLKALAFVKKLSVSGQLRAAMPDAYGEVLYYDIGYEYAGESYIREIIHHEFYHMIEEEFFGDMYYHDPLWKKINPKFNYGSGGASAYTDNNYKEKDHPFDGFVSVYSTYGLEEDKAEIYAYLMSTEYYPKLVQWSEEDRILSAKVTYMINFMHKNCIIIDRYYFININLNNFRYYK